MNEYESRKSEGMSLIEVIERVLKFSEGICVCIFKGMKR